MTIRTALYKFDTLLEVGFTEMDLDPTCIQFGLSNEWGFTTIIRGGFTL